jgi:hypothetical protein
MPKYLDAQIRQRTDCRRDCAPLPPARLRRMAEQIHALGPWPLFNLLRDVDEGRDLHTVIKSYAGIYPLRGFIEALGGRDMPPPVRLIRRRR